MLIARRDDVAKNAAADGADDKARGSVVALAVIAPVAPAIDAVVMAQAARLVGPPVAVVAIGIPGFPRVLGALAVGGRPGGRIGKRGPCDRFGDQARESGVWGTAGLVGGS